MLNVAYHIGLNLPTGLIFIEEVTRRQSFFDTRKALIPCVVFGRALMTPEGSALNDFRDAFLKKGIIVTREEGIAWVTVAFMWILAQTCDPSLIRRILT